MVTTLEPEENIKGWNRGTYVRISQSKKTRVGVPLAFTYLLLEATGNQSNSILCCNI